MCACVCPRTCVIFTVVVHTELVQITGSNSDKYVFLPLVKSWFQVFLPQSFRFWSFLPQMCVVVFFSLSSTCMVQIYTHQTSPLHCHLQADLKQLFLFHYTCANQGLGTKLKQQFCPKPSKWNLKTLCRNQLMDDWCHKLCGVNIFQFLRDCNETL